MVSGTAPADPRQERSCGQFRRLACQGLPSSPAGGHSEPPARSDPPHGPSLPPGANRRPRQSQTARAMGRTQGANPWHHGQPVPPCPIPAGRAATAPGRIRILFKPDPGPLAPRLGVLTAWLEGSCRAAARRGGLGPFYPGMPPSPAVNHGRQEGNNHGWRRHGGRSGDKITRTRSYRQDLPSGWPGGWKAAKLPVRTGLRATPPSFRRRVNQTLDTKSIIDLLLFPQRREKISAANPSLEAWTSPPLLNETKR